MGQPRSYRQLRPSGERITYSAVLLPYQADVAIPSPLLDTSKKVPSSGTTSGTAMGQIAVTYHCDSTKTKTNRQVPTLHALR